MLCIFLRHSFGTVLFTARTHQTAVNHSKKYYQHLLLKNGHIIDRTGARNSIDCRFHTLYLVSWLLSQKFVCLLSPFTRACTQSVWFVSTYTPWVLAHAASSRKSSRFIPALKGRQRDGSKHRSPAAVMMAWIQKQSSLHHQRGDIFE